MFIPNRESSAKPFIVFISSVMDDLKVLRHTVYRGLKQYGYAPFVFEINGVASSNSPLSACLEEVEEADFFVAIFTERLGDITKEEYPDATEPLGFHLNETTYKEMAKVMREIGFNKFRIFYPLRIRNNRIKHRKKFKKFNM